MFKKQKQKKGGNIFYKKKYLWSYILSYIDITCLHLLILIITYVSIRINNPEWISKVIYG